MTRKPRGEAHVDTLLAKVMKRTAECGEEIDAKLAAVIGTCVEPTGQVQDLARRRQPQNRARISQAQLDLCCFSPACGRHHLMNATWQEKEIRTFHWSRIDFQRRSPDGAQLGTVLHSHL